MQKSVKKNLNIRQKCASYITASVKRLGGFLVFPSSHAAEVKGWLVWLLGGGRCNGVRPFFIPGFCLAGDSVGFIKMGCLSARRQGCSNAQYRKPRVLTANCLNPNCS